MSLKSSTKYKMYERKRSASKLLVIYLTCILAMGTVVPSVLSDSVGSWWNTEWSYRKLITINPAQISGVLENFPMLVQMSDSDLMSHAQPSGNDIVFILFSDNTTKLDHEIEYYNGATGTLCAWVNLPHLSATSATKIWMYYGNPSAGAQEDIMGTWDSNYVMVQHLNETGSTMDDSTMYDNDGVSTGTNFTNQGKIDGARLYNGNDRIVISNFTDSPNGLTVEAWVYRDTTDFIVIAGKGTFSENNDWMLYLRNNQSAGKGIDFSIKNHTSYIRKGDTPVNSWFSLTATYGNGNVTLYLNGTKIGNQSGWPSIPHFYPHLGLGNDYMGIIGGLYPMSNVMLDELRVSNIARNSSWITTSYHNQLNPAAFYSVGGEETYSPEVNNPPIFGTPTPLNGSLDNPLDFTWNIPIDDPDGDLFTWSIQCSNGATNSGGNALNGTKSLPLTGLAHSTTYKVWVNATDPTGSSLYTRRWYIFTTIHAPAMSVVITKPVPNTFYFNDADTGIPLLGNSIVYGKITITVNVTSDTDISKVEFYVDGKLLTDSDPSTPYTCEWKPIIQFNANLSLKRTIKVIVYDSENNVASAEVNITKWRFHPLPFILAGASYATRLVLHTTMVGIFFNVKQSGNRVTSFYVVRAHFKTAGPLVRSTGVLNFRHCTGGILIGPMTLTKVGPLHKFAIGSFTYLGRVHESRVGLGSALRNLR